MAVTGVMPAAGNDACFKLETPLLKKLATPRTPWLERVHVLVRCITTPDNVIVAARPARFQNDEEV